MNVNCVKKKLLKYFSLSKFNGKKYSPSSIIFQNSIKFQCHVKRKKISKNLHENVHFPSTTKWNKKKNGVFSMPNAFLDHASEHEIYESRFAFWMFERKYVYNIFLLPKLFGCIARATVKMWVCLLKWWYNVKLSVSYSIFSKFSILPHICIYKSVCGSPFFSLIFVYEINILTQALRYPFFFTRTLASLYGYAQSLWTTSRICIILLYFFLTFLRSKSCYMACKRFIRDDVFILSLPLSFNTSLYIIVW